ALTGTAPTTQGTHEVTLAVSDESEPSQQDTQSFTLEVVGHEVTATAGANGSVSPASQTLDHEASAELTLTPDSGYAVDTVTGCAGTLDGLTYTTDPVTASCEVEASFVRAASAGTGSDDDPFVIDDGGDLASMGQYPDSHFVVDGGVDGRLNAGAGWESIGSEEAPFTGSVRSDDGNPVAIEGLDGEPLFDVIGPGAEVGDLTIEGSINDAAGDDSGLLANAVVGEAGNPAIIDNVAVDGDSRIGGGSQVGGLAGSIDHAELSNVTIGAEVGGDSHVGGLAGTIRHSTIVDTEVTGDVSATDEPVGGLAAELVDTEVTDSRVTGTVNGVAPSDDATLSALAPSSGSLAPAFDPATLAYDVAVSHAVDSFSVTPTLSDPDARITLDGERVESGTGSPEMSLAVGSQTLELVITAPDWSTSTYAVTVTRAAAPAPTPPDDDDEPVQDENVEEVSETIGSLPPVDELTLEHRGAIEDARAAYETLDPEQQAQVDNLDDLIAAEERLEELLAEQSGGIVDESGQALGDRTVATGEPVRFRLDVSDDVALAISGTVRRGTETRDLPSGIAPTLLRDPDGGVPVLRLEDGTYVFESERGGIFTLVFTEDDGETYSVQFEVRPQVAFTSTRQFGTAGESVEVRAVLEGTPAQYPVTVSYDLAGSDLIDSAEPGLQPAGEFRFVAEGEHARLRTLNLTPNARTGEITLALRAGQDPDYALPGDPAEHRILLREAEEVPLAAHLELEQDGRTIRDGVVTQADGPVTLRVDPETGLAFDWSNSDLDLEIHQATGNAVTFVPQGLDGVYHARLRVTDSDEPGRAATLEQRLRVVTDRDAIPSAYRDFYSDDPDQRHILPICRDGTFRPVGPGLCAEDSREVPVAVPEGYQVRLGLYSEAASWASGQFGLGITPDDLRDATGEPALNQDDPPYDHLGYLVDFEIFDLQHPGQSVPAVIPLPEGREIPEQAVWRKWRASEGWQDFVLDDANQLHSAPTTDTGCPWPGSDRWTDGLSEGDHCVRLIIEDGGPNDRDGERDGVIRDPGTLATPVGTGDSPDGGDGGDDEGGDDSDDTESRGGGGASGPLLLLGLLGLGLLARTRRRPGVAR
ncbi:MAG: cadherin-like beta sandwich domain-containing protein, partial [Pseudomonadota bacterium]